MGLRSARLGVGNFAGAAEAENVYCGDFQDLLRSGGMSKVYCNKMRLGCDGLAAVAGNIRDFIRKMASVGIYGNRLTL